MCLHRYRQLGPGHATARSEQLEAVLRRQNALHLRLGQTETLYAVGENVLRQWTRHRGVSVQANQGDIEALEEETIAQKCRSVYSEWYQGGTV